MSVMQRNPEECYTVAWIQAHKITTQQEKELNTIGLVERSIHFDGNDTETLLKGLQSISNEIVFIVTTGTTSNKIINDKNLMIQIHGLPFVRCIYVDEKYYKRYESKDFAKVRFAKNDTIIHRLSADLAMDVRMNEPLAFNSFDERSSMAMNGDFMHFQLLIDHMLNGILYSKILDNYSTFAKSRTNFVDTCKEIYKYNSKMLEKVENFDKTYRSEQALNWYTRDSFPFGLLNQALRTNDARLILMLRFFIMDLHRQLTKVSQEPFTNEDTKSFEPVYRVYRGQLMSKDELNNLRKSLGNLISMKSFFSTSLDQQVALMYLGDSNNPNEKLLRVLIEIDLGSSHYCISDKSFANITKLSEFGEAEQEVLFTVSSLFRVQSIRRGENGIHHVRLLIANQPEDPLHTIGNWSELFRHFQNGFPHSALIQYSDVGTVLFQSGKFNEAEIYYEQLIKHLTELVYVDTEDTDTFEHEKWSWKLKCLYMLGRINFEKGLFDRSVIYYQTVLRSTKPAYLMPRLGLSWIHVFRALCRLGLGATYELNGKLNLAKKSYEKASQMFEEAHYGLAILVSSKSDCFRINRGHCFIGLGNLCLIKQQFTRADAYYSKALAFFDEYLPADHPDQWRVRQKMATITEIYRRQPSLALEDYGDCLENYLRSLPSDHVDIGRLYVDIARCYEQLPNELRNSFNYAQDASKIFKKYLPVEHTDTITVTKMINRLQRKLFLQE